MLLSRKQTKKVPIFQRLLCCLVVCVFCISLVSPVLRLCCFLGERPFHYGGQHHLKLSEEFLTVSSISTVAWNTVEEDSVCRVGRAVLLGPFYPSTREKEWDKADLGNGTHAVWRVVPQHCTKVANKESLRCAAPSSITVSMAEWESPKVDLSFQPQGTDQFL